MSCEYTTVEAIVKNCECRAENGNCLIIGGFCTSVPKEYCNMALRLQKYQALGTVEELREAMEKQRAKKPILNKTMNIYFCPVCERHINYEYSKFCSGCGQAIDWSEERSNHEN